VPERYLLVTVTIVTLVPILISALNVTGIQAQIEGNALTNLKQLGSTIKVLPADLQRNNEENVNAISSSILL
jgi:hypothetical protein